MNISDEHGIYFCTFTVINWMDVFSRQRYRDIVIENFRFCQQNKGLKVYAFVIMSNNIHCIVSADGDNLSDVIGNLKSYTAKKIIESITNELGESRKEWMLGQMKYVAEFKNRGSAHQFWKDGNHPEIIFNNYFFSQKINYIHQNPVRAGIDFGDFHVEKFFKII